MRAIGLVAVVQVLGVASLDPTYIEPRSDGVKRLFEGEAREKIV